MNFQPGQGPQRGGEVMLIVYVTLTSIVLINLLICAHGEHT